VQKNLSALQAIIFALCAVVQSSSFAAAPYQGINLRKYQFNDDVACDCESISKTAPTEIWELLVRECLLNIQ